MIRGRQSSQCDCTEDVVEEEAGGGGGEQEGVWGLNLSSREGKVSVCVCVCVCVCVHCCILCQSTGHKECSEVLLLGIS